MDLKSLNIIMRFFVLQETCVEVRLGTWKCSCGFLWILVDDHPIFGSFLFLTPLFFAYTGSA